MAATLTDATVARRYGRIWVRRHYAKAGIRLTTAQARYIWSIGMPVEEYVALRTAFGLDPAPAPAPRKARKATPAASPKPAPKVFTSSGIEDHIDQPGSDSAWVDPKGTYYRVGSCGHNEFASKAAAAGIVSKVEWGSYVPALEAAGWLHLSFCTIVNKTQKPTAAQADTLIAWAKSNKMAALAVEDYFARVGA